MVNFCVFFSGIFLFNNYRMKKSQKIPPKYICEVCDYTTSVSKDYCKHLMILKHKNRTDFEQKNPQLLYFQNNLKKNLNSLSYLK